jgi:hypothetical protein
LVGLLANCSPLCGLLARAAPARRAGAAVPAPRFGGDLTAAIQAVAAGAERGCTPGRSKRLPGCSAEAAGAAPKCGSALSPLVFVQ